MIIPFSYVQVLSVRAPTDTDTTHACNACMHTQHVCTYPDTIHTYHIQCNTRVHTHMYHTHHMRTIPHTGNTHTTLPTHTHIACMYYTPHCTHDSCDYTQHTHYTTNAHTLYHKRACARTYTYTDKSLLTTIAIIKGTTRGHRDTFLRKFLSLFLQSCDYTLY